MSNENQKSSDKYSKLAGNTLIFAISSFSSKLLTLIVQPFLTYAMAEISDLGLAKILSQYANLLIPFVSMGMSNAIIRFGLDKGNSEKQVFTNGLLTILQLQFVIHRQENMNFWDMFVIQMALVLVKKRQMSHSSILA